MSADLAFDSALYQDLHSLVPHLAEGYVYSGADGTIIGPGNTVYKPTRVLNEHHYEVYSSLADRGLRMQKRYSIFPEGRPMRCTADGRPFRPCATYTLGNDGIVYSSNGVPHSPTDYVTADEHRRRIYRARNRSRWTFSFDAKEVIRKQAPPIAECILDPLPAQRLAFKRAPASFDAPGYRYAESSRGAAVNAGTDKRKDREVPYGGRGR